MQEAVFIRLKVSLPNNVKQCGKVFVSSNPKKEYCDKHTPQSYYAMKKRLKNK